MKTLAQHQEENGKLISGKHAFGLCKGTVLAAIDDLRASIVNETAFIQGMSELQDLSTDDFTTRTWAIKFAVPAESYGAKGE